MAVVGVVLVVVVLVLVGVVDRARKSILSWSPVYQAISSLAANFCCQPPFESKQPIKSWARGPPNHQAIVGRQSVAELKIVVVVVVMLVKLVWGVRGCVVMGFYGVVGSLGRKNIKAKSTLRSAHFLNGFLNTLLVTLIDFVTTPTQPQHTIVYTWNGQEYGLI